MSARRALLIASTALAAVAFLGTAWFHPKQGLDFAPEYVAARMLADHGDLRFYDHAVLADHGRALGLQGPRGPGDPVVDFSYPPWLAVAYVPVSRFPWDVARAAWFVLSAACVAASAAICGHVAAPSADARRAWALGAVLGAGVSFPVVYGLMSGQANETVLLLTVLCLALLRSGHGFAAGLALAPAALWKIFPGFLVVFLLARREGRAVAGLAAGCAALFLASLPFVGVPAWADWFEKIVRHQTLTEAAPRNQSIAASVLLLFAPGSQSEPLADAPSLVRPLTLLLQGAAVAALVATLLPRTDRRDARFAVQFAAVLVLGVLLAPYAWDHYGVYLIPAAVTVLGVAAAAAARAAFVTAAAAAGVWAFAFATRDAWLALSRGPGAPLLTVKTCAALALLACCAIVVRRTDDTAPVPA